MTFQSSVQAEEYKEQFTDRVGTLRFTYERK